MLGSSITLSSFYLIEGAHTYEEVNGVCPPDNPNCEPVEIPPPSPFDKVSYNKRKKLAILNPGVRLEPNTTYTAVVEGAGDTDGAAVEDKAGNEMATDYIWRFTTESGGCDVC